MQTSWRSVFLVQIVRLFHGRIISPRVKVWVHKPSLSPPHSIEMQYQSCISVLVVLSMPLSKLYWIIWNSSDSFFPFFFSYAVTTRCNGELKYQTDITNWTKNTTPQSPPDALGRCRWYHVVLHLSSFFHLTFSQMYFIVIFCVRTTSAERSLNLLSVIL